MKKLLLAGGVAASVLVAATASYAANCSTSDISLTIGSTTYAPASCANAVANGSPADEAANLNTGLGTTGFVYLAKFDADHNTSDSSSGIGGIVFTVTTTDGKNGTWRASWNDTDPTTPLNLPVIMDLEVGLFGGNNGAGYLFDNVELTANPAFGTGDFTITFLNNGNKIPDISHLTLAGGNASEVVNAPEPMSLALLGSGLLGLTLIRRRT